MFHQTVMTILLSLWLLLLSWPVSVLGDRMIRFTFNDGVTPTLSNECTADDNRWIDPLFNITANLRGRRLELFESIIANDESVDLQDYEHLFQHHRELYSAQCRDNCAGYARGTCRATGCWGYRRKQRELSSSTSSSFFRQLFSSSSLEPSPPQQNQREEFINPCNIQLASIHAALDLLILSTKISAPCKLYLTKSKRKAECFDDVIYGEILSFTFYNMNLYNSRFRPVVSVIGTNVQNGFKVCNKVPLNVEAVLNPCVNMVHFNLTGPNNFRYTRIDDNHPMLLVNTTTSASTFGGMYLSPGSYSLITRPDNFAYKEKKLDFTVIAC